MAYNLDSIIEYLSSPAGLNNIVLIIIVLAMFNAIFISYALRNSFIKAIEEEKKDKNQKAKIDRLYPSTSSTLSHDN